MTKPLTAYQRIRRNMVALDRALLALIKRETRARDGFQPLVFSGWASLRRLEARGLIAASYRRRNRRTGQYGRVHVPTRYDARNVFVGYRPTRKGWASR